MLCYVRVFLFSAPAVCKAGFGLPYIIGMDVMQCACAGGVFVLQ